MTPISSPTRKASPARLNAKTKSPLNADDLIEPEPSSKKKKPKRDVERAKRFVEEMREKHWENSPTPRPVAFVAPKKVKARLGAAAAKPVKKIKAKKAKIDDDVEDGYLTGDSDDDVRETRLAALKMKEWKKDAPVAAAKVGGAKVLEHVMIAPAADKTEAEEETETAMMDGVDEYKFKLLAVKFGLILFIIAMMARPISAFISAVLAHPFMSFMLIAFAYCKLGGLATSMNMPVLKAKAE